MIDSLYNLLTKIGITRGQDKVLHVIAGFITGVVVTIVFGGAIGFLAGFAVAIGKELYDKFYDGVVDYFDMFFTLFASTIGVMLVGGLLNISPLYSVYIHKFVFFAVLAVYGGLIYWLFVDKD